MWPGWLRKPAGEASIVFVHGILSDGDACWQHSNGISWPELLEKEPDLTSLGIYVFSYQTGIFSGSYRLSDIVDALKEQLRLDNVLACNRLVFVCHSMGGLVVRKFLVERSDDLIKSQTEIGLFLVGSPSLGSSYANWLSPIAALLGHAQAKVLQFVRKNDWLKDLDKEFMNLKESGKLSIKGKELVEDKSLFLKKAWRRQIVEPFSGARYFGEPFKVAGSDHVSIAKPVDEQAIQHRLLVQFVKALWVNPVRGAVPHNSAAVPAPPSGAPPVPSVFLGRTQTLADLKQWLGIGADNASSRRGVVIVLRGWPGIGKTAISAALAHDPDVSAAYSNGVLWTSLGESPNLIGVLARWGKALGSNEVLAAPTLSDAVRIVSGLLANKQALLLVDDVWEIEHGESFRQLRGDRCSLLFTTRLPSVADALALPDCIFNVPALTENDSLDLMRILAPSVSANHPKEVRGLVRDLEYLPLALHVAGRLLNKEASRGWNIPQLLSELSDGVRVLSEKAPSDRIDIENQTIPTVAVLLQKSIERLDPITRKCFSYLGPFAPKPASFDLAALRSVWLLEDPKPVVDELVDRGLLEPVGLARFQMHALLVSLARSLLK